MLRASARLLRPGGRTAFFTIHPAEGLSHSERRRVSRHGPVAVAVSRPHRYLLEAAGLVDITETDASAEFTTVIQAWVEQWDAHRPEMEKLWGPEVFKDRQRQ